MFIIKYNNAYVRGFDSKRTALDVTFNKTQAMKFDSKNSAKRFILNRTDTVRNSLFIQPTK